MGLRKLKDCHIARRPDVNAHKLQLMSFYRLRRYCMFICAFTVVSCRDRHSNAIDSTAIRRGLSPVVTGSQPGTGWDSTAGPVLVLAIPRTPTNVAIVLPGLTDSTLAATSHFELRGLANIPVDLFNPSGLVGSSILRVSSQQSDSTGCVTWPIGELAGEVPTNWRVALEKGRATGLRLDSIEATSAAHSDSSAIVAYVLKAALSLGNASNSTFRGIPFTVRQTYRFETSELTVLIAEVVRKINEEANPREEHILFLAERARNSPEYHVAFQKRSAGAEESLETSEILAALHLSASNHLAVVLTFDYEDGGKIGLLERVSGDSWQVVWKSAYTGC
jgi:hypothetical protein